MKKPLSSLVTKKAGNEVRVRGAKRPSHTLVPVPVQQGLYRVNTRYSFNIALPRYFYLIVYNQVMTEDERVAAKNYFVEAIQGVFRVIPRTVVIEKVRVNFMTQLIEVNVLVEDCLYDPSHMNRISATIYESFRTMRDEHIRPHWLQFIEQHNVKYRIKRRKKDITINLP